MGIKPSPTRSPDDLPAGCVGDRKSVDSSKSELSTHGFIDRMNMLVKIMGSANALARGAGISQGGIRRYFEGGEPSLSILVALARTAGVNLLWLATGEGEMRSTAADSPSGNQTASVIDTNKLKSVLIAVKEAIQEGKYKVTPTQEAEIVSGVYELTKSDVIIPKSAIFHLLNILNNISNT